MSLESGETPPSHCPRLPFRVPGDLLDELERIDRLLEKGREPSAEGFSAKFRVTGDRDGNHGRRQNPRLGPMSHDLHTGHPGKCEIGDHDIDPVLLETPQCRGSICGCADDGASPTEVGAPHIACGFIVVDHEYTKPLQRGHVALLAAATQRAGSLAACALDRPAN